MTKNIEDAITPFIEIYCNDWEYDVEQEHYKWDAIKSFAKTFDIEAEDLASNLKESMSPTFNLLAGPYYYPLSMLRQMALYSPEDVRNMIFELYDENVSLSNRCTKFLQDFESLLEENRKVGNFKDNDRSMQSVRAISVYLSLKYPNIHYLYKQSMYSDFKSITGADLPSLSQFESVLVGYEIVCEEIRKILLKNERLIALHDKSYPEDTSDYHLLTQDFCIIVHIIIRSGKTASYKIYSRCILLTLLVMIIDFFKQIGTYLQNENDLSDITCAMCHSSVNFKNWFVGFFFPNLDVSK